MIREYRFVFLYGFLISLAVFLFGLYYHLFNPYYYIGLWFRALWLVIIFGFLAMISFIDFKKIAKRIKNRNTIRKRIFNRIAGLQEKPRTVINWLFQITLIIYLTLLIINEFVKLKYGLNTTLIIVLVFATLTIIYPTKEKKEKEKFGLKEKILIIILSIVGSILVYLKTKDLGWLSYLISIITGLLIYLVGYLIYEDEETKEEKTEYNYKKIIIYTTDGIIALALILYFFIGLNAFRIVFGSIYVLFLPGFVLSFAFFEKKEIGILERIALSFALSIAVVPLVVFYLNLIGMKINAINVSLVVLGILIIGGLFYVYKRNKRRN